MDFLPTLLLVCGRPILALCPALVPQTLSCSVALKIPSLLVHYLGNKEIKTKIERT